VPAEGTRDLFDIAVAAEAESPSGRFDLLLLTESDASTNVLPSSDGCEWDGGLGLETDLAAELVTGGRFPALD
jgi:hypothetical protein